MARAMATDPALLLLDEVTAALDPELTGEVLEIMRRLAGDGTTMVLATHEMAFARDVATKVCFLHDGADPRAGPARPRSSRARARSAPASSCGGSCRSLIRASV